MNFGMLKNMVENLVSSYTCPFCSSKHISEKNIDIVGAAGNTVNIDMHCPNCDKHFMAKTEVIHMEIGNVNTEKIQQIKNSLSALKGKMGGDIEIGMDANISGNKSIIRDENIQGLHKDMQKKGFNASDLFPET